MPRRTARIGGRRVYSYGVTVYVKTAGKQVQKTFPLNTSEDTINRWALDAREALKAQRPQSGTLSGDVRRFLDRLPDGARKENLRPWLNVWLSSPLGQRSRASITRGDVLNVLDAARQSADRRGTKGARYSGSSQRHIRQALITLYRELDGRQHQCPARDVEQAPLNQPRQGFFEADILERVIGQLPAHYADVVRFAAFSGWRRAEIQGLLWSELDERGGVIRLSPERSKTREGRVLPVLGPIAEIIE
jgi:integrase